MSGRKADDPIVLVLEESADRVITVGTTRRTFLKGSLAAAAAAMAGCLPGDDDDATGDDDDATGDDDDATGDDDDATGDDDDATGDDDDATSDELPDAPGGIATAQLLQPTVIAAAAGALSSDLTFGFREWSLDLPENPQSQTRHAYNLRMRGYLDESNIGSSFGPTFKLRAGDTLSINLINQLPAYVNSNPVPRSCDPGSNDCDNVPTDHTQRGHNFPTDLNVTNLHTHGLQVSPQCPSDYIFNTVEAGESFQYAYGALPDGATVGDFEHTAGTYWYHAHKHGSVAPQMWGGGVGFILVEGALDDYLREDVASGGLGLLEENEFVLGFSNLLTPYSLPTEDVVSPATVEMPDLNVNATAAADMYTYPVDANGQYAATGQRSLPYTLINGQFQPTLRLTQNTPSRLRVLNGRVEDALNLAIYPLDANGDIAYDDGPGPGPAGTNDQNRVVAWNYVAFDGLTLAAPVPAATDAPPRLLFPGRMKLAPANRADVIVQLADAGWYALVDEAAVKHGNPQQIMGYIYVDASTATPVTFPTEWDATNAHFPPVESRLDSAFATTGSREVNFQVRFNSTGGEGCATCPEPGASGITPSPMMNPYFLMWNPANTPWISAPDGTTPLGAASQLTWPDIDDVPDLLHSGDRLDMCLVKDSAEEWTIYNYSAVMHPFHIHVNPFFVTAHGQGDLTNPQSTVDRWQDTVPVPGARFDPNTGDFVGPGFVKFRTRYLNWTGDYVAHCHKVSHEDIGMMINLRVGETTGDLTCPTDPYAPDPAVPYIDSGAPTRCED